MSKVKKCAPVSLLIPAYNEESSISSALFSLLEQSVLPDQIIVVDDSSSDRTAEIARGFEGVTVVRTPKNSGSKGHALNYGLAFVNNKYTMTMDADITLEKDGIKKMVEYMENKPNLCATCTFVLPKQIKTVWDHTRFVEYIFSLSFYKSVQQMYDSIIICSGCFTIYNTVDLKSVGGWPTNTVAEDMELTWVLYNHGKHIGYSEDTLCYAVEPDNFHLLSRQLKRWNTGFFQVFKLQKKNMTQMPVLREFFIAGLIDTIFGTLFHAILIILTIVTLDPSRYLYFIAIDIVLMSIPSLYIARKIHRVTQLIKSMPIFLVFRLLGAYYFYYGLISIFVIRKGVIKFEKGHK